MSRKSILSASHTGLESIPVREDMARLLARDPRFSLQAYRFVLHALRMATIKHHGIVSTSSGVVVASDRPDHVTGQQLSYVAAELASNEYGFLAYRVLSQWGIRTTGDIGDIVYHMIEENHMQRSPADNRADFDDVFDMKQLLETEFQIKLEDI